MVVPASVVIESVHIGAQPVLTLTRPPNRHQVKPQFLAATVIPGKGMNLWQIRAYIPGQGDIDLLHAAALPTAQQLLDHSDNLLGNNGFTQGGAILLPYANRLRGSLIMGSAQIEAEVAGEKLSLPANWQGKAPAAEPHAIHGLLLNAAFKDIRELETNEESGIIAGFQAGDFAGHWLSNTVVTVKIQLRDTELEMTVIATNVGSEVLPMGIGWHPYFVLPSGQRQQARLYLPAVSRAEVNNYDDVFPSGKLTAVKGTAYDFSSPGGVALGGGYLDDCFTELQRNEQDAALAEIIDPAAHYGLRIHALSPEIKAIQVYAPPDKNFIAIEPQFNLADPFNPAWGDTDTGMVLLQPARSVSWRVKLELFVPGVDGSSV